MPKHTEPQAYDALASFYHRSSMQKVLHKHLHHFEKALQVFPSNVLLFPGATPLKSCFSSEISVSCLSPEEVLSSLWNAPCEQAGLIIAPHVLEIVDEPYAIFHEMFRMMAPSAWLLYWGSMPHVAFDRLGPRYAFSWGGQLPWERHVLSESWAATIFSVMPWIISARWYEPLGYSAFFRSSYAFLLKKGASKESEQWCESIDEGLWSPACGWDPAMLGEEQ